MGNTPGWARAEDTRFSGAYLFIESRDFVCRKMNLKDEPEGCVSKQRLGNRLPEDSTCGVSIRMEQ